MGLRANIPEGGNQDRLILPRNQATAVRRSAESLQSLALSPDPKKRAAAKSLFKAVRMGSPQTLKKLVIDLDKQGFLSQDVATIGLSLQDLEAAGPTGIKEIGRLAEAGVRGSRAEQQQREEEFLDSPAGRVIGGMVGFPARVGGEILKATGFPQVATEVVKGALGALDTPTLGQRGEEDGVGEIPLEAAALTKAPKTQEQQQADANAVLETMQILQEARDFRGVEELQTGLQAGEVADSINKEMDAQGSDNPLDAMELMAQQLGFGSIEQAIAGFQQLGVDTGTASRTELMDRINTRIDELENEGGFVGMLRALGAGLIAMKDPAAAFQVLELPQRRLAALRAEKRQLMLAQQQARDSASERGIRLIQTFLQDARVRGQQREARVTEQARLGKAGERIGLSREESRNRAIQDADRAAAQKALSLSRKKVDPRNPLADPQVDEADYRRIYEKEFTEGLKLRGFSREETNQ